MKDIHHEPPTAHTLLYLIVHLLTSIWQVSQKEKLLFKDTTSASAAPGPSLPVISFFSAHLLGSLRGLQP